LIRRTTWRNRRLLRRDRPAHHAGDAERERPPVARTDLDRDGHPRQAGSSGLSVLARLGTSSSPRYSAALLVAIRHLTAPQIFCHSVAIPLPSAVPLCTPVNAHPFFYTRAPPRLSSSRGLSLSDRQEAVLSPLGPRPSHAAGLPLDALW
jgi:hypothetical protein